MIFNHTPRLLLARGGALISVGTRGVLVLTSPDIDELSGETLENVTAQAAARLRQALGEAAEARAPRVLPCCAR